MLDEHAADQHAHPWRVRLTVPLGSNGHLDDLRRVDVDVQFDSTTFRRALNGVFQHLVEHLSDVRRVAARHCAWRSVDEHAPIRGPTASGVRRGVDQIDHIGIHNADAHLAGSNTPHVGKSADDALQLRDGRIGFERGADRVEQFVDGRQSGLSFGACHARLDQFQICELQLLAMPGIAHDRHGVAFAARTQQLTQRDLHPNLLAAPGPRWHLNRRVGVDDQPVPSAHVPLHAGAVNMG